VTVGNIQQKALSDIFFWIKTENSTNCPTEVEFVHAVTAGGSAKFFPAV